MFDHRETEPKNNSSDYVIQFWILLNIPGVTVISADTFEMCNLCKYAAKCRRLFEIHCQKETENPILFQAVEHGKF